MSSFINPYALIKEFSKLQADKKNRFFKKRMQRYGPITFHPKLIIKKKS